MERTAEPHRTCVWDPACWDSEQLGGREGPSLSKLCSFPLWIQASPDHELHQEGFGGCTIDRYLTFGVSFHAPLFEELQRAAVRAGTG